MRSFAKLFLGLGLIAFPPVAAADAPARGTVVVVHAWQDFLEFHRRGAALESAARAPVALDTYAGPAHPFVHGYFARLGAGDASAAVNEWLASTPFDTSLVASLSDTAVQARLLAGAEELGERLGRVVPPADTAIVVLLVGGSGEPTATYDVAGTPVVAARLEEFLGGAAPQAGCSLADLYPWCAYASTALFLPELRERKLGDSASLAETVLLQGFSTRLAAALYPESRFAGGRPAVSAVAYDAVSPKWREIGGKWFPFGTEPYLSAVFEDSVLAAVPEGVPVEEAVAVLGTALAKEWLDAARISRGVDEGAEIARLGRFPTLYAWGLLRP